MTKRMLWYVCLGLLCCLTGVLVVYATGSARQAAVPAGSAFTAPQLTPQEQQRQVLMTKQATQDEWKASQVQADGQVAKTTQGTVDQSRGVAETTAKTSAATQGYVDQAQGIVKNMTPEMIYLQQLKALGRTDAPEWQAFREEMRRNDPYRGHENNLDDGGETCATATVIGGLPFDDFGSTVGAVHDYNDNTGFCEYEIDGAADEVYSFTPAAAMEISVDLCNSGYDTKTYIYAGDCTSPANIIACSDDACSDPAGNPFRSFLLCVPLTAGITYYIVVDGWNVGDEGAYELHITECAPCVPTPPHDACENAVVVNTLPFTENNTTLCASTECQIFGDDVWYQIVLAEECDLEINFCGSATIQNTARIVLETVCPCSESNATWVTANNWEWTSCGDGNISIYWPNLPAGTYWYSVYVDAIGQTGPYTISMECAAPCQVFPPHDACENAVVVNTLPFTENNTTLCAQTECQIFGDDVWYQITTVELCDLVIDFCGSATIQNTARIVLETVCPCSESNATWIFANTWEWTTCGDGNITIYWPDLPAGTYWYSVYVDAFAQTGPYTINIDCTPPVPCVPDFVQDIDCALPYHLTGDITGAGDDCDLHFNAGSQDHTWQLNVLEPGFYTFDMCVNVPGGDPCFWDSYIYLTDACCGGTIVGAADDGCGCFGQSLLTCVQLNAGTYYLDIEEYAPGQPFGAYDVTITCCAPPTGRCCYGDPENPDCAENTLAECDGLGGEWVEGAFCPCPVRPPCPTPTEDVIFSQRGTLPDEAWAFNTTDEGSPYAVYDNFSGLVDPVGSVRVFGLRLDFNTFTDCPDDPMSFVVSFFDDDGFGMPDTTAPVCTYLVSAPAVATGLNFIGFNSYFWDLPLPTPCAIDDGWLMIRGTGGSGTCWFLWHNSLDGDGSAWQLQPPTMVQLGMDQAFCLVSGVCDPASELTVIRQPALADAVNIRFLAPSAGNYKVWRTIVPNNDGDPDDGADPDWSLLTTVNAVAGYNTTTDTPLAPYVNYVVVHDCSPPVPMGRCCYGDPGNPSCDSPVSLDDCNALSGSWNFGQNCIDNPCPVTLSGDDACGANNPLLTNGQTVFGTTVGATTDGTWTCGFNGGIDVWYRYTATATNNVTVSLCGSAYDTMIMILDGCGGVNLGCIDDFCGLQSEISFPATMGTTYWIAVGGYNSNSGNYQILVTQ